MPVIEITITVKHTEGMPITVFYDVLKGNIQTVGAKTNSIIAGVLVQEIIPLKEAIDRAERMSEN